MRSLKDNLNKFVENENDKVMLVTGVWGVGKTHQVVNEWAEKEESLRDKYKVVTLFGCENIDGLIWDILVGIGGISIIKNCLGLVNIVIGKLIGVNIPSETIIKLIPTISNKIKTIEKILIIDDTERKNDNIKFKEILNLVESIKKNFKKIILIMDQTKLNNEDNEYLNDYFEKIIDRHYDIKEPSEEAKHSILTEIDDKYYNDLEISNVKNLRTLQKLNSFAYELKNSSIKDKPEEIKMLYYKLYLFAYRMVKNNEFSAQDCAEQEGLFVDGLLLSDEKKSEYEKLQNEEENFKRQLFIYSHYSEGSLLTRQVSERVLFNKVIDLGNYFSKFIDAIKSGDIERIFDIEVKFSYYPKNEYEYTPLIYGIDDIKNIFNDIDIIIHEDKYDPVSVYINYFNCCIYNGVKFYQDNKEWFEDSFVKASKEVSKYLIENKYIYPCIRVLSLNTKLNDVGKSIETIINMQLEDSILSLIENELNSIEPNYSEVNKLFEPYKVYKLELKKCVDNDKYMKVGKRLINRIFAEHSNDFYSTFRNVYTNCFYNCIDVPFNYDVKKELISYAEEKGYIE